MSWVNPRTWSVGELATAAKMNEIRDALRWASGDRTTTVPGSPNDGDQLTYPADTTNGVMWEFKYRSGSASSFKWEFVGGAPMFAAVATDETTASTTYVDLATVGPAITLPRAGDYECTFGFTSYCTTAGPIVVVALKRGASASVDADGAALTTSFTATPGATGVRSLVITGMSASDVVKLQYKTASATSHFIYRWLAVRPIRIS